MEKKDTVMKKLKGLEPNQERLWYVEIGKEERFAYDERPHKIYFKTQEQALQFFKMVTVSNPLILGKKELHSWSYEHIKEELKDEDLKFTYIIENNEISLHSEVVNTFPTKAEAEKAMLETQKDLEIRNKAKEPKDKK